MKCAAFLAALPLALAGCWSEPTQIGTGEPFRVRAQSTASPAAQFIQGTLPGSPPIKVVSMGNTPSGKKPDAGPVVGPPEIVEHSGTSSLAFLGETNYSLQGSTTPTAYSVGIALEGIGTGYWVLPVGAPDPTNADDRPWSAYLDFDDSIPAGTRNVLEVALDQNAVAGRQTANAICLARRVPDNFITCKAGGKAPPFAVISLRWDTNVDLDLQVLTPDGVLVEPKHPLLTAPDGGKPPKTNQNMTQALDGIDHDSNAGCVIDGNRQEDLVFYSAMPHGPYQIFANLFSACGQPAVHFRVEVYASSDLPDGGKTLTQYYPRPVDPQGGELLDISANGGAARGLFVTEFTFK